MIKLVGVDLGTSGVRVDLYSLDGEILSSASQEVKEQTINEWECSIKEAFNKLPPLKKEELLLTVQSTSGTSVLVDEWGKPVSEPIMYHERAENEAEKLSNLKSTRDLFERGVTISSTSPVPKILRFKDQEPFKFKNVRWILPPATWLLYRLYFPEDEKWLNLETDWTNALKFGEDVTKSDPDWYTPFFEEAELDMALFPKIVRCGKEIGEVGSNISKEIGIKDCRLFHGMTDGNSSALAVGCLSEGDFGFSCGTTTAVKYVSSQLKMHPSIYYHAHPLGGFMAGAAPLTAGFLDWFADKIIGINVETAIELAKVANDTCFFFPQGDRSPFYDAKLGASILNIWPVERVSRNARGSLFRSMVLGLTYFEYYYISLFEGLFEKEIMDVKITGGGTRSRWWNSLRASIYEKPVTVMEERYGIGALIPITLDQRLFEDKWDARSKLLKTLETFYPDKKITAKYFTERNTFMKKWEELKDLNL